MLSFVGRGMGVGGGAAAIFTDPVAIPNGFATCTTLVIRRNNGKISLSVCHRIIGSIAQLKMGAVDV